VADLLAFPILRSCNSRAALQLYGENEFPVPPLALPDTVAMLQVEVLSQYRRSHCSCSALFAVKQILCLTRRRSAVAEICARLDGCLSRSSWRPHGQSSFAASADP